MILATTLMDNELVLEVRKKLDILLLLVHAYNLELFTKQALELFLQAKGKGQPSHIASIAPLPEVDSAFKLILRGIFALTPCSAPLLTLFLIIININRYPVTAKKHITILCIEVTYTVYAATYNKAITLA